MHGHGCGRNERPEEGGQGGQNLLSQSGRAKTFHHKGQDCTLSSNPTTWSRARLCSPPKPNHRSGNFLMQPLKLGVAFSSSSSVSTSRLLLSREGALTNNNIKKARYLEERARKTKNVTRRERSHRAAYRYRLAAAKELEAGRTLRLSFLLRRSHSRLGRLTASFFSRMSVAGFHDQMAD